MAKLFGRVMCRRLYSDILFDKNGGMHNHNHSFNDPWDTTIFITQFLIAFLTTQLLF